ncbi:MAG: bifunctional diaminohydroxyphosphoribosylaminopyrimidine deaminase/5-amino-6-(5-phosphoribosylamino)uracil reductase RibD [Nitrospirae bacterium]|nr:bifunctional diaminohydroxyphosphoribosylaminopyrimidine deaminase/5-amino-6-(5-phosphoribosylamino)uracil reductase RibD [Nitrospirota bacterium]
MDNISIMKKVLILAAKASGMTSPNPMVGAILMKNGKIITEDYHRKPGTPHAEALVLQKAGENTKGATLYVNLEPCCHTDKRTPPCTRAIINAGIKKVVIGMKDPNPKVSGKGIQELEKAGVKTVSEVLEEDAKKLNEAYIKNIRTGRPFVTLKVAMTLDGKIATPEGESKWITGEKARGLVHKMRGSVDAIITAIGTVKADNPFLTARIKKGSGVKGQEVKNPKRIVIDPELEIPMNANVLKIPPQTIIISSKQKAVSIGDSPRREGKRQKAKTLIDKGIQFIEYKGERLDMQWLMKQLGALGITSILIEGGSSLNSYALEAGIVDKVMFFIAPKIIGGEKSFPAVGGNTFKKLSEAYRLRDMKVKKIGDDILIEGYINSNRKDNYREDFLTCI